MTNMTQGEILSALASIETMVSICEENRERQYLLMNDVKTIMPFVNKAQKAAEKLLRFSLDYFNSNDEQERELSRMVCYKFGNMHSNLYGIKFNGLQEDSSVDWLNNNIKSVTDLLNSINLVVPALPESANTPSKDDEEQSARIKELEEENKQLKEQLEEVLATKENDNPLKEEIEKIKQQLIEAQSNRGKGEDVDRLRKDKEDMIAELLAPAFFNDATEARRFLKKIDGLDNVGIADVAGQFLKDRKIAPSKSKRDIWKYIHAAKLYDCTEQNWSAAIRKFL